MPSRNGGRGEGPRAPWGAPAGAGSGGKDGWWGEAPEGPGAEDRQSDPGSPAGAGEALGAAGPGGTGTARRGRNPFARELGEDTAADDLTFDGSLPADPPSDQPGSRHFPCASCGGDLVFAPGQTQLVCPYCGNVQQIPAAPSAEVRRALRELDYRAAVENRLPAGETEEKRVTRCPNCGAEVELDENIHADRCPFCDSAVVTDTGPQRLIKPQAVLPFVLTEDQARERMVDWLGRLWFAPSGLQAYARRGRRLSGIYVPYFTFDAATRTRYQGQRGIAYTEIQVTTVYVDGRPQRQQVPVRKIRWTPVAGQVARRFDDVLVLASTGLPRKYAEELDPWNLNALKPYSPDWLAGFRAESYTVELPEAHGIAAQRMQDVILMDIRRDIGGDAQRITAADTQTGEETFKHILLPIWTAAYRYGGKSYSFIVNGQTGEVQGERPYSAWKIALAVIAGLIVAALVLLLTQENGRVYRYGAAAPPALTVAMAPAPAPPPIGWRPA